MKKVSLLMAVSLMIVALVFAVTASADDGSDFAQVRAATARFHRTVVAEEAGWVPVVGLDHCFNQPGVGGMGYHYINLSILDTTVDMLQPEAMVYAPGPNGQLQLSSVEYIVPAADWDAGNQDLPSLFGHEFHLNTDLGVYVLHAWIWMHNSNGIFADWNPQVTCS